MNKKLLGAILLISFSVWLGAKDKVKNLTDYFHHYYTIDGFEVKNEWKVYFSRFRSRKWDKRAELKDKKRESNREWYDWFRVGDGKPKLTAKEILPDFIFKNRRILTKEKTILGIKARWDRKGHNWISIEPYNKLGGKTASAKPAAKGKEKAVRYGPNKLGRYPDQNISDDKLTDEEYLNYDGGNYIILPGQTKEVSLYVWGNMYDYSLKFHLEDYKGKLYVIDAGTIKFKGWYRVGATIPEQLVQLTRHLPRAKPLKLKRIKLILNPKERISGSYIYIDYLHGKTDTYLESFFGEALENSQRIWKRKRAK